MPAANDKLRFACIGFGIMGQGDVRTALMVPQCELVAVSDLYNGRLQKAKEVYGQQIATTRDFREVLARPDIDAVIIGTPDHWHAPISIAALQAGKHVYCEKPMVHSVTEGHEVIAAAQKSGKVFQVGSQYVSSPVFTRARDLLKSGAIGKLNMVEAWLDRNSAQGAWQYTIPPDASPQTVDWDRFLGSAPKRPFEPIRFFRWRNYNDYGTGMAGDLFVHLLSGLHTVTGSQGPVRIYTQGGLRFWKDGREVPDVMLALMDYPDSPEHPEFTFALRVDFVSPNQTEPFGVRFVGSEGTMTANMNQLLLNRTPREFEEDYSISAHSKANQEKMLKARPPASASGLAGPQEDKYLPHANMHLEHHKAFQASIRSNAPQVEDAVFGFRAAGPALLVNHSYYENAICRWDPKAMKRV